MGAVTITRWDRLRATAGRETTLESLAGFYDELSRVARFRGDEHPGWSPAKFVPCRRAKENVREVFALTLDYDADTTLEDVLARWQSVAGFAHTTKSHRPDAPRCRVILELSRPVTAEEYTRLWLVAERRAGAGLDESTKDASRFWYMPGIPADGEFDSCRLEGAPIDVDGWLSQVVSATRSESTQCGDERRADPAVSSNPSRALEPRGERYARAALKGELEAVRLAANGTRNATLNNAALKLGRLAAGGLLDSGEVRALLTDAGHGAGLDSGEISRTIESGLSAGLRQPRELPPPRSEFEAGTRAERDARSEPAPRLVRLSASDIFAPLPPVRWLIEALDLCPGAPAMVAGYGFSGKTAAVQALALAVASGQRVWGTFAARRGRVLHLDYEQGAHLTRQRYQRLAAGMLVTPHDLAGLELVSMPELYLDAAQAEDALCRECEGVDLMIVDSLRAACPSIEENSSDARRVLDVLARVSEKTGCVGLVIHHARKPQKDAGGGAKMTIRGSGAIFDACASVLVLEADKGRPTRVSHEKARTSGRPTEDFTLRISDVEIDGETNAGLSVVAESRELPSPEAEAGRRLDLAKARLRTFLDTNGPQSKPVLRGRLAIKNETLTAALNELVRDNEVVNEGTNRQPVWSLVGGQKP